jgi:hypothetical protein
MVPNEALDLDLLSTKVDLLTKWALATWLVAVQVPEMLRWQLQGAWQSWNYDDPSMAYEQPCVEGLPCLELPAACQG